MKNIIKLLGLACLILITSCSGEIDPLDYVDGGEIRYPGKANNLVYRGGKNRLEIQFTLGPDPSVDKTVIYWNLKKDSVVINIDRASLKGNTITKVIENLPEDIYNFEIYTYDKYGNKSVPSYLTGRTYGDRYANVLADRGMSYEFSNLQGDVRITWADSIIYSSGAYLEYTDLDNNPLKVFISNKETERTIKDGIKYTKRDMKITTFFIPEPYAIDTFYTSHIQEFDPSNLPVVVEMAKPYAGAFVAEFDTPVLQDWNSAWGNIWNGNWGKTFVQNTSGDPWADEAGWTVFGTNPNDGAESTWLTIDIKEHVKLARYRTGFYWPYMSACPRKTELWAYTGTGAPTKEDGWNNWVKIGSMDNSALTHAEMETQYGLGDNLYLDATDSHPVARYYRLRCYDNWDSKVHFIIAEVTFWAHIGF
jgi:hypothetical protein